jgi:phage shock protein PspC (stress-responsive transcriptional regulator)
MITPPRPCAPADQWFYSRDGKRFGPTDFEGLQVMADNLHLRQECKVVQAGSQVIQSAGDLMGLRFPAEPPPLSVAKAYPSGLYRSTNDKLLLGLCGGLAHRFTVPAIWLRLILVLAAPIALAYPLCWFLEALPTKDEPQT